MNNIIEEVLKLPEEEKIKVYCALQKELGLEDNNVLREDELTPEQWEELKKREIEIEKGNVKWISRSELEQILKERRNGLQANRK
ncbi:MAG: hypothetical protein ACR2FN_06630 [Chitinophagaceae bacterium]